MYRRKAILSINRKSSKSLYINGFRYIFYKKFIFLKCRKKHDFS
nr:MAG TPA: hypothetical protein [Caudoviricetes sp.]